MMNNNPVIEIIVEGGAVQEVYFTNIKEPVQVMVKDLDVQDLDHPHIDFDEDGIPFVSSLWMHSPAIQ